MNRSLPQRKQALGVLLLLLAVCVLAWKSRQVGGDEPLRKLVRVAPGEVVSDAKAPEGGNAAVAPASVAEASPEAATPSHAGQHGDACAHCLAEKKLTACREDYAAMMWAGVSEELDADPAEEERVREACRRVAAEVLTEWSFSESRPVLAPDPVVEARRREWLEPVLASIPRKSPAR
jgi:hypothetical protein